MPGPECQYILCLVRLNEDGTICESFLKAAAPPLPRVSREAPLDEAKARVLLMAAAGKIEGLCRYLQAVADVMPASGNQEATLDDRGPFHAVTNMELAVDSVVVGEYLRPAAELLRRVSTVTDEDLRRDFEEQHAKFETAQK